jgi:hypothetical protein
MDYLFDINDPIKVKKTTPQINGTIIDRNESGDEDDDGNAQPNYKVRYESGIETWHTQDCLEAA